MDDESLKGKFRIGVLAEQFIDDYQAEYQKVRNRARESDGYRLQPTEISRILESNQCY